MPGTLTVTTDNIAFDPGVPNSPAYRRHTLAWVSNSGGSMNGTTFSTVGELRRVTFIPSSPAPTNAYDMTLVDANGIDVLGGGGADQSNTTAATIIPAAKETTNTVAMHYTVAGTLELKVTNAGNATAGTVVLYMK